MMKMSKDHRSIVYPQILVRTAMHKSSKLDYPIEWSVRIARHGSAGFVSSDPVQITSLSTISSVVLDFFERQTSYLPFFYSTS